MLPVSTLSLSTIIMFSPGAVCWMKLNVPAVLSRQPVNRMTWWYGLSRMSPGCRSQTLDSRTATDGSVHVVYPPTVLADVVLTFVRHAIDTKPEQSVR